MSSSARRGRVTTLRPPKVTYARIELVNRYAFRGHGRHKGLRGLWQHHGFTDVSPRMSMGRTYMECTKLVMADWYLLTGHHARIYAREPSARYAGFFNELYHQHIWEQGDSSTLLQPWPEEIYIRTTSPAPAPPAPGAMVHHDLDQDNPLLDPTLAMQRTLHCKGIILAGCNGLGFYSTLNTWRDLYKNVVIIGAGRVIGHSAWVSDAVVRAPLARSRRFWEDPSSVLTDKSQLEKLARQLAWHFIHGPKRRYGPLGIGIIYRDWGYMSRLTDAGKLEWMEI